MRRQQGQQEARTATVKGGTLMGETAPSLSLPFRYMLAAVLAFLLAAAGLPFYVEELLDFYYQPHLLAFTHLITLGWITMTGMGATFQMVPVALETKLYSERLGKCQFWLMLVGTMGMVGHFWIARFPGLALSAMMVLVAGGVFILNLGVTLWRLPAWTLTGRYIGAALIHLAATLILGSLMAADKLVALLPGDFLPLLHAHAHLATLGWVGSLIFGVAYKVLPMFTLSVEPSGRASNIAFWLYQGGVVGLFVSILAGNRLGTPFALMVAAAVFLIGQDLRRILRARRRAPLDGGIRSVLTAFAYLLLLLPLGIGLNLGGVPDEPFMARLISVYTLLGLLGWISQTITGMMYKIIPFLVWYHRYGDRVGLEAVPALTDLYSETLQRWGYWIYNVAVLCLAVALLGGVGWFAVAASGLLALGVLSFSVNMLLILQHMRRPEVGAVNRQRG